MSLQEAERRRRQSARDQQQNRESDYGADRVMSFRQWCELIGVSVATGRRILMGENGPETVQLSPNRIGITIRAHNAWLASRARG